jgi:hypothetical protein
LPPESAKARVLFPGVLTSKFSITVLEFFEASLNLIFEYLD